MTYRPHYDSVILKVSRNLSPAFLYCRSILYSLKLELFDYSSYLPVLWLIPKLLIVFPVHIEEKNKRISKLTLIYDEHTSHRKSCMNRKQLCCSGYRGFLQCCCMSYCVCYSPSLFCAGCFSEALMPESPFNKKESEFFAFTNLSKFITIEPMKLQHLGYYF